MTQTLPLINRTALVTGAQQGIGREIAMALGRAGAHIVANYLDDEAGAQALALSLVDASGSFQTARQLFVQHLKVHKPNGTNRDEG